MDLAEKLRDFISYPEEDDYIEDDYYEEDAAGTFHKDQPSSIGKSSPGEVAQVVLVKPEETEDAKAIADHLAANHIVILNLETVQKDIARRLIDFLVGAAYAKSGQVKRIANSTYVILPFNIGFSDEMLG